MAHYERDKDDGRVYDGSEDDEDGEGSHLPVVIIIAILVLAAFGGVVWLAYNQGVARGRNEPVRVASTDTNAGAGIKVYQQQAGADDEDDTGPSNSAAAIAQATQPASAPVKSLPKQSAMATKPPAQLSHPARETAAPRSKPVAAVHKPAPVARRPHVAPKPAAVKASPKRASGGYALQIGAYKSEAEAMAAWKVYRSKHAALLAGFSPEVQRADLGSKGVWYRLRIPSFADKEAAVGLCDRLKSQHGACFLAR